MKSTLLFGLLICSIAFNSCSKDRGINIFTVSQDMEFGNSLVQTIDADPTNYPVLDRSTNLKAYEYIEQMMADILKSNEFKYGDRFEWEVFIIDKDVINAFAAPGGKMYFYTGLIKYLEDGATMAGVMGHEMAHADLRHSTQQMTKLYGLEFMLNAILGQDKSQMTQIASDLALGVVGLKFSKDNEYDADRYSMYYLATTGKRYDPKGITAFFTKMINAGSDSKTPEWLRTHPSDQNRIDAANEIYNSDDKLKGLMGSKTYSTNKEDFLAFQALFK